MNRREAIKRTALIGAVVAVAPLAACGPSKDQAIRYTDIAINYLHDILPILPQIGGEEVVTLVNKAIPLLEKLKKALEEDGVPQAGNLFDTIINTLGAVANALLRLPESAKRNTVIGILTLVQVTLRTVGLFVESETPSAMAAMPATMKKMNMSAVQRAFDATRF